MKRMLFNGTQQEELRVAIVDGQKLIDIDIETAGREQHKSNIYKAVITRIEPSLEACFVNYGEDRHGFLPFKEVSRSMFRDGVDVRGATIKNALREGQELMVQIEKEERGNKGAALTTFVSLAGRYLVLMPNNPRGGGVSRRVEGEERQELRETMDKLDLPPGMSVIARTAGIGRNVEELQWDLNYLLQLWQAIESAGSTAPGAFLIYHESSLVIRAIRDYFQPDIGEILVDTDEIYEQARQFMSHVMPDMVHRVKRYRDDVPLFSRFQIEHQIETAYSRHVPLPSGGSIVIDHTEALVSIDVNSARSTRGTDIETAAFNTNCEAAEEAARQMRLRDLGGLIVIDFIDMESAKNQREIENRLKEALRYDRARVQMGKISRFGLMELSRQRLRPSLSEGSHVTCPRCNGTGHIRDIESSALQVLRIIEEESMKENSAAIQVQIPVDVAAFLLNEKRGEIFKIETRHEVTIILIPNKHLETPHYKLERIKHDDTRLEEAQVSYALAEQPDTDAGYGARHQKESTKPRQEAMVKSIPNGAPAPVIDRTPAAAPQPVAATASPHEEEGFLSKLFGFFRKKPEAQPAPASAELTMEARSPKTDRNDRNGRGPRSRNRRGGRSRDEAVKPVKLDALESPTPMPAEVAPSTRPPRGQSQNKPERQRNERRPSPQAEKSDEAVQKDKAVVVAAAAAVPTMKRNVREEANAQDTVATPQGQQAEALPVDQLEETNGENGVSEQEQQRRRRRRGGRNRNRRDRDRSAEEGMGENESRIEGADGTEFAEAAPVEAAHADAAPLDAASDNPLTTPASHSAQDSHVSDATISAAAPAVEAPFCWTIADQDVPQENSPAEATEAQADSSAMQQPVEEVAETPSAAQSPQSAEAEPATSAADSATETPSHAPEKLEAPATEVTTTHSPAPVPTADVDALLAAAGLSMASTDPKKLQAAQAKSEEVEPPRSAPRERRRSPAPVEEPLVQVDTRRE